MTQYTLKNRKGFTLVELSIVIIVIALIVSGIMAGNELITQARIRSSMNKIESYKMMLLTFKMQYNALPGDMINASTYWPNCDPTPTNCNGNGNQYIAWWNTQAEGYRLWQQLHDAGLLAESYSGTATAPSAPQLNFGGGDGKIVWYPNDYWSVWRPSIKGIEFSNQRPTIAYAVDMKYDDGLPGKGSLIAFSHSNGICTQNAIPYDRDTQTYIPSMASADYCRFAIRGMYGTDRQLD